MFTILLLAALGQCGPSGCPAPSMGMGRFAPSYSIPAPVYAQPAPVVAPRRMEWLDGFAAGGSRRRVWGWRNEAGQIAFVERDQPASPPAERPPSSNILPPDKHDPPATEDEPAGAHAIDPPKAAPPKVGALVFGVRQDRLGESKGYQTNGEAGRRFAEAVIQDSAAGIPDDGGRPYVTAVGTAEECGPVLDALRTPGPLADAARGFAIKAYRPDDPLVKGLFPKDGHPTIIVQRGDGYPPHNQPDFADGAAGLLRAMTSPRVAALRQPNPNFDPAKVPDLRRGSPDDATLGYALGGVLLLAGACVVATTPRKRPA